MDPKPLKPLQSLSLKLLAPEPKNPLRPPIDFNPFSAIILCSLSLCKDIKMVSGQSIVAAHKNQSFDGAEKVL